MTGRQIAFYVDTTRCINCRTCEIACKDANDAAVGVRIRRVRTLEGGEFPAVWAVNISMSCNHCEDPICLRSCPSRAYSKRESDGAVVHDPARCLGCRYCTWVCPYGAPQYDPGSGRIFKCNMCDGLVPAGEPPVCVTACPMRVIEVGPLSELEIRKGATAVIRHLPSASLTRPAARYKVRPEASSD